jgi:glycosyltransferase involved in cell wall biosynthesis
MVPDVSVVTPSLEQGRFIEDCIRSVMRQQGLDVEHVIQDGGSRDDTLEVMRRYDHVVKWASEPDRGQSDALNKALTRANGRWIAWQNADDFYLPGGLASLVRTGDRTGADVVHGEVVAVDVGGKIIRSVGHHNFTNRGTISSLFFAQVVHSSGAIIRRSVLPPDPWEVTFRLIMDQEFFLKIASRGARFRFVRYPVAASRVHGDAMSLRSSPMAYVDEYTTKSDQYGVSSAGPFLGKSLHRVRKLVTGAYLRQFKVERLRGRDLRWFRSDEGRTTFANVLQSCYGIAPPELA